MLACCLKAALISRRAPLRGFFLANHQQEKRAGLLSSADAGDGWRIHLDSWSTPGGHGFLVSLRNMGNYLLSLGQGFS